jgi:hypothetical protein
MHVALLLGTVITAITAITATAAITTEAFLLVVRIFLVAAAITTIAAITAITTSAFTSEVGLSLALIEGSVVSWGDLDQFNPAATDVFLVESLLGRTRLIGVIELGDSLAGGLSIGIGSDFDWSADKPRVVEELNDFFVGCWVREALDLQGITRVLNFFRWLSLRLLFLWSSVRFYHFVDNVFCCYIKHAIT